MSQQNQNRRELMVQGRLVWVNNTGGDLFKGKGKTDQNTRQPVIDPKTGLQKIEYGFGLAVPLPDQAKQSPEDFARISANFNAVWAAMHEEAYSIYPSRQLPPGFAMKYKLGTDVDKDGQLYSLREGYLNHIVLSCTTSIPIKYYKWDNGANVQINEGIKCGDYVNVQLSIKAHASTGGNSKPGLYLNPNAVQWVAFGEPIINTPSGDQLFGTQAPVIPFGGSATPFAPPGMLVPQSMPAPGYPPQQMMPPPMPGGAAYPAQPPQQQQQYAPPAAPQAPAAPHWGVLPPIHQPQPPQGPPAMPGVPQMQPQQFAPPPQQQQWQPPATPGMPMPQGYPPQQMAPPPGMPPMPGQYR